MKECIKCQTHNGDMVVKCVNCNGLEFKSLGESPTVTIPSTSEILKESKYNTNENYKRQLLGVGIALLGIILCAAKASTVGISVLYDYGIYIVIGATLMLPWGPKKRTKS